MQKSTKVTKAEAENKKLKEINADLRDQLDSVTDKLQEYKDEIERLNAGVIHQPDGGLGGPALLRSFILHLSSLDPGLTVGADYDFELAMGHAKDFWVAQGGKEDELD